MSHFQKILFYNTVIWYIHSKIFIFVVFFSVGGVSVLTETELNLLNYTKAQRLSQFTSICDTWDGDRVGPSAVRQ